VKKFILIIVIPILLFGGGLLYLSLKKDKPVLPPPTSQNKQQSSSSQSGPYTNTPRVVWEFTGEEWRALGTPPPCVYPLVLSSPVDIDMITAIMYPGQTRSKDYKAHGGFAFPSTANKININAPLGGHLIKASRYVEQGETQYLLVFLNDCGIMYRLDHLRELAPKFKEIVKTLPEAKANDSHTTDITAPVYTLGGELIATKIGFLNTKNIFVDFGVYDLRKKNGVTKQNDKELAPYGICWLNSFSKESSTLIKARPLRDQASGKTSDYCK
jgi:hypothetical protein